MSVGSGLSSPTADLSLVSTDSWNTIGVQVVVGYSPGDYLDSVELVYSVPGNADTTLSISPDSDPTVASVTVNLTPPAGGFQQDMTVTVTKLTAHKDDKAQDADSLPALTVDYHGLGDFADNPPVAYLTQHIVWDENFSTTETYTPKYYLSGTMDDAAGFTQARYTLSKNGTVVDGPAVLDHAGTYDYPASADRTSLADGDGITLQAEQGRPFGELMVFTGVTPLDDSVSNPPYHPPAAPGVSIDLISPPDNTGFTATFTPGDSVSDQVNYTYTVRRGGTLLQQGDPVTLPFDNGAAQVTVNGPYQTLDVIRVVANALRSLNGGQVTIWSDPTTQTETVD